MYVAWQVNLYRRVGLKCVDSVCRLMLCVCIVVLLHISGCAGD